MASPALKTALRRDEGESEGPYLCPAGYLTIGVGHRVSEPLAAMLIGNWPEARLTDCQIDALLDLDIQIAEAIVARVFRDVSWEHMGEPRREALVNMAFNLGPNRLMQFRGMIRAIRAGDWARAELEALYRRPDARPRQLTPWARQVGDRAKRIAYTLRTGERA